MTQNEALLYLEANHEDWEETLALKLFNIKKELFQRVLVPRLVLKKAEKVALWYQAECSLLAIEVEEISRTEYNFPVIEIGNIEILLELYRTYESKLTRLQLELSQANTAKNVTEKLTNIGDLEIARQQALLPLAKEWGEQKNDIKITDEINTGAIISELNQCGVDVLSKKELLLLPNFKKDLDRTLKSN